MNAPEEVLSKIPKNAPPWAVGVVTIIVSLGVVLTAWYVLVRTEVQEYLKSEIVQAAKQQDGNLETDRELVGLIRENSSQITQLSGVLFKTQDQNSQLAYRVSVLEKELAVYKEKAEACEEKLKNCK